MKFTEFYYKSLFTDDYYDALDCVMEGSMYDVPDTWDNYEHIANFIDERFEEWQNS